MKISSRISLAAAQPLLPLAVALLLAGCGTGTTSTTTSGPSFNASLSTTGLELNYALDDSGSSANGYNNSGSITFSGASTVSLTKYDNLPDLTITPSPSISGNTFTVSGQSLSFVVSGTSSDTTPGIYRLVMNGTDSSGDDSGELFLVNVYPNVNTPATVHVTSNPATPTLNRINIGSTGVSAVSGQVVSLTYTGSNSFAQSNNGGIQLNSASNTNGVLTLNISVTNATAFADAQTSSGAPFVLKATVVGSVIDNGQNPGSYYEQLFLSNQ